MALGLSENFFALFGLPVDFTVAQDQLVARYRELQQTVHPDRYASASDQERRVAMQRATQINEGYQTLKDPLARARYLLELNGVNWEDEKETMADPEFLMEQMERRETLAEAREQDDPLATVGDLLDALGADVRAMTGELGESFQSGDLDQAKTLVRRLQFLYKLRSEAEALEADLEDEL